MGTVKALNLVVVLATLAIACGGRVTTGATNPSGDSGDKGGGGQETDASTTTSDAPTTTSDAEPEASITCAGSSSIGYSDGTCSVAVKENCSDGTTYQVMCSCPGATCSCFQMNGASGGGTTGVPYSGCAIACSVGDVVPTTTDAWQACGYPVP